MHRKPDVVQGSDAIKAVSISYLHRYQLLLFAPEGHRYSALPPRQERAPTLGAESFPYKGTERCWQLGSDSKNVGSIRPGNSKFTVRLLLGLSRARRDSVKDWIFFFFVLYFPKQKVVRSWCCSFPQLLCSLWSHPQADAGSSDIARAKPGIFSLRKPHSCVPVWLDMNPQAPSAAHCFLKGGKSLEQRASPFSTGLVPRWECCKHTEKGNKNKTLHSFCCDFNCNCVVTAQGSRGRSGKAAAAGRKEGRAPNSTFSAGVLTLPLLAGPEEQLAGSLRPPAASE